MSGGSFLGTPQGSPPSEEPAGDTRGWGQSSGSTLPHQPGGLPTPACPQFPPDVGLTSFLRWPGLHLLGLLALDGAQRQHHGPTGAPCGQETVSAWAVQPGGLGVALRGRVDSDSSIPSPRIQIPSIQGDVLAMPPSWFPPRPRV